MRPVGMKSVSRSVVSIAVPLHSGNFYAHQVIRKVPTAFEMYTRQPTARRGSTQERSRNAAERNITKK